jgi:hypothetical protein
MLAGMKSLSLIARLPHLSHDDFRRHYEQVHVPLSLEHFRFARYVRNFVTASEPAGIAVDCVGEFTLAPGFEADLDPAATALFAADRALFMKPRGPEATARVAEEALFGPARAPGAVARKRLHFLRSDGLSGDAFVAAARAWGRAWEAAGAGRATLDRVLPGQPDFPADAVVSVWLAESGDSAAPPLPAGISAALTLQAEEVATPLNG